MPRSQARFNVTIDGNPQLVPIPGTQLNYVDNASAPIIQLDRDHWYGFQAGIWFAADTVTGPWRVTDSVPSELYAMPPSSPVYHAVQARVFASSSSSVYIWVQRRLSPDDDGRDRGRKRTRGLLFDAGARHEVGLVLLRLARVFHTAPLRMAPQHNATAASPGAGSSHARARTT